MNGWGRRSGFRWIEKERSAVITGVYQRSAVEYQYSENEKVQYWMPQEFLALHSVRISRYHVIIT